MKKGLFTDVAALFVMAPLVASSALAGESYIDPDTSEQTQAVRLVVLQGLPGSGDILQGSYQEGLEKASAALTRQPQYKKREMKANICAAQLKLGQFDAANESCEAALAIRPTRTVYATSSPRKFLAVAHVNHGVVHLAQGDLETAEQQFRRAWGVYPSLREAESNLALTQQMMGRPRIEVGEGL